jgi:hypothetical protein
MRERTQGKDAGGAIRIGRRGAALFLPVFTISSVRYVYNTRLIDDYSFILYN